MIEAKWIEALHLGVIGVVPPFQRVAHVSSIQQGSLSTPNKGEHV